LEAEASTHYSYVSTHRKVFTFLLLSALSVIQRSSKYVKSVKHISGTVQANCVSVK